MTHALRHRTLLELEQTLPHIMASPTTAGVLQAIFVRPRENERQALDSARLSPDAGIEGDRWVCDHWQKLADGRSDPRSQLSLMNARVLRSIAGDDESMSLAGDNLIVDLDLSQHHLPAGSRLRIGDDVVIEISTVAHTGCGKFARRFGKDAQRFVNGANGKALHLRGHYATIIQGGLIQLGDRVDKIPV